jgi:hypothetical protein
MAVKAPPLRLGADPEPSKPVHLLPHVHDETFVVLHNSAAFLVCASWEEELGLQPLREVHQLATEAQETPCLL